MKHRMNRKAIISLIVAIVAIICIITTVAICHLVRENKLEDIQNEVLAELERNEGKYDERSIVLQSTSKARAEELAALFGAELRITENGRYARLMLPEDVSVKDVWSLDANRVYLEEMSADYQVSIAELESEEDKYRLPVRPNYTVTDSEYSLQTYLDYLNMQNAWNYGYTGSGVTVAVIDTGIDTDHPEFAGRISEYSYNATEDKIVKDWMTPGGNYDWSLIEDEQGHGTAVAGVVAGTMNSGNIVGIAPNVNIIVIKAECDEFGNFYRTSDLVFGLYYAIERDVQVVNMSFGTSGPINPFAEATQLAYDSDIICVAAAGNNGTSALTWPAADENVIGVGALEENSWTLANYSNYGENSDIVAPGTVFTSLKDGKYGDINGTSFSSPIVAASIALFMQNNRYTTFDDVAEVLFASSYDLGALGEDWDYGYGALDVDALILGERGTVTFDMLTDELENEDGLFIRGIALQSLPEPERLYAVFDGWYYDDTFTQAVDYYADAFEGDLTLYAKWVNEDDGIPYTYVILEDGTVEIRSYTGHRRFITVPEKIEERIVSSIGDFAFSGQTRLREISLPSGLTNIGRYAFENCSNLVSIEIPGGVKKIGDYAFENNVRLYTVAFAGNSVLERIGDFTFSGCGNLERIELPASLTSVNGSAFFGTTALTAITVRNGNAAFISKDGVLFDVTGTTLVAYPAAHGTTYTVPEGTINIADYSFPMARIKNIDLGTIQTIGKGAFVYSSLESLTIPDSVISMGISAFEYNTNLTSLSIGRGLTAISEKTFAGCSSLKSVTIPNGIRVIDISAFNASGLESIVFESGSTLSAIGSSAFYNCQIKEIDIPASVIDISDKAFSGFLVGNPLERVGFASDSQLTLIGSEAFAKCYPLESIVLPHSLKTIGSCAFMSSGMKNITVPASVTELGNGAFACCDGLASIEIEDDNTVYHDINGVVYTLDNTVVHMYPAGREEGSYTVESVARSVSPWAFAGTSKLGSVILPEGMTEIGEYGFYLCGAYSYSLPSTLVEIEQYAFSENINLGNINIPDNVLQIGRYAFAKSYNLYAVNFNTTANLPRISFGAFAYSGIQYFTVPANVSTIAQGAFEGCKNLYSVTFAENSKLESISAYMFDGCENLQSITFNNGSALTSIQAHGLEGMDNLTSINFGDAKLTNVDNFAFRFCESLSNITFPDTLTSIGRYAFYGCKSLSELTIPVNVEHIGSYAFLGTNELDLYLAADSMPEYLDENWDHGLKAYYTGVTSVNTSGDYKYATLTSGNIAIIEYLGTAESVDLSTLDLGAPITTIGGSAFKDSTVKKIILPETLTEIQAEAFMYTALESISIPASVTFIGREAFAHTDIATLNIPANSSLKYIEQYAFEGTEYLKSVTLPASLEKMGTGTFLESGLEVLIFADGIKITEIPQKAFAETNLISVSLPDSVTLVNHNAFNNVETLTSVSFGNNVGIRLMSNAFYHTGLTSLTIPANVTYIGEYCFVALPNLTSFSVDANNSNYVAIDGLLVTKSGRKLIAVPAGRTGTLNVPVCIEEIGFGAFEESKLSAINFDPNANILTFGYRAFFKAENITEMHIPASVVSIDYYAFAYCENLKTVTFAAGNKLKGIYEGAFCGDINLENIVIPDSIVEISDFAFYGCSKITKLPVSETNALKGIYDYAFAYTGLSGEFTTPETLIDIGNYAFLGCKFTKVTIPDTNKKQLVIGIGAFEGCNYLTEITLPFIGASFEDEEISWFGYIFGAGAYAANETYVPTSLKTVTITEGITFVGIGGFAYCTGLETINVPHSVSVLYNLAFAETTARYELTNTIMTYWKQLWNVYPDGWRGFFGKGIVGHLTIADSVTSIGRNAFSGCSNLTSIHIPNSVTSIESDVFSSCSSLTSITIPDSVTSIAYGTFSGCSSLASVIIPDGVTSIGARAFERCKSLSSITIPDSVTSIGSRAFSVCTSLTSITIPDGVTSIGCFSGCTSLTSITIPDSVTSIAWEAFSGCSSLTSITIPKGVNSIGENAFSLCQKLFVVYNYSDLTLTIGSEGNGMIAFYAKMIVDSLGNKTYKDEKSGFTYIDTVDEFRFMYEYGKYTLLAYIGEMTCVTLPEDINGEKYDIYHFGGAKEIVIPDGVTSIGEYAFYGRSSLTSITIPDSVTSIGDWAFYDCSSLTSINIPDSVTSIGSSAFFGCTSLESITIPDSVTSIGGWAFYDCSSLTSITIPDSVTDIASTTFSRCTSLASITIPDSVTSISGCAFAECTSLTSITIPDGVTSIEWDAFSGCSKLSSVYIPHTVSYLASSAFPASAELFFSEDNGSFKAENGVTYNALTGEISHVYIPSDGKVIIPKGVTSIGGGAFAGCSSLTNITIPNSVTSIGSSAFSGCTSLESITIPDSVTSIGGGAFAGCSSLTSITIPDSVTSIGSNAFSGCASLTSITIPDSVTNIGYQAFFYCTSLTSANIPNSVTSIGKDAFSGCSSLTSITIPDSVTSIGSNAFSGCASLTSITIPDGVTSIEWDAFSGCSSLTSINIPDSVTSIGSRAFSGCTSLTNITIPNSVTSIGSSAFSGCTNLTSITIPDSVTDIASTTFSRCTSLASITIPDGVTSIGSNAFWGCSGLASITIPDGVTSIEGNAFWGCSGLTSITIPYSVTSIGDMAFWGCDKLYVVYNNSQLNLTIGENDNGWIAVYAKIIVDSSGNKTYKDETSEFTYIDTADGFRFMYEYGKYTLLAYIGEEDTVTLPADINGNEYEIFGFCGAKEVIIPDGVTQIGEYTFSNSTKLTSITIPDSVTSIGYGAFLGCTNLTNVVMFNGVTRIEWSAFERCTSLTSISIPDSVTSISGRAFAECTSLTSVTIGNSVTSIGARAFYDCTSLTSIDIPDSVTSIGGEAFINTALYNNPDNWHNGMLVVDGLLIAVDSNTKYLNKIENLRSVVSDAYSNAYSLKNAVWEADVSLPSNVETLYVTNINQHMFQIPQHLTLKNIIICDSVSASDLRHCTWLFSNLTGITIFVEQLEEDLRWDDNFPGWNYGNTVVYGDDWHWMNFYDKDGTLIYSAPTKNAEVIKPPVYMPENEGEKGYIMLGWDLGGDGKVDSVPATSIVDIDAYAVVVEVPASYTVTFMAKDRMTPIYSYELPYLAEIPCPEAPTLNGYDFLEWAGYTYGMTVESDIVFYSEWSHHGGTHAYSEIPISPSCTEQGYILHLCSVCGESYKSDFTDALGHNYGEWIVDVPPTCTVNGTKHRVCTCGHIDNAVFQATGHNYEFTVTQGSTCENPGIMIGICKVCGDNKASIAPVKNHKYVKEIIPSEILNWFLENYANALYGYEDGKIYVYRCVDCRRIMTMSESDATQSSGIQNVSCKHETSKWIVVKPASCVNGLEVGNCLSCGKNVDARILSAIENAHDYESVTIAPTCTEKGKTTHTCKSCGYSYTDSELPALNHDISKVPAKPQSCTEVGWNEYDKCSRCDYSTYVELPALTHDISKVPAQPATCTEIGWNEYDKCSRCDYSTYVELPMLDHKYISSVIKPDYQVQGYTLHTCEVCGYSFKDNYTDALTYLPGDINGDGKVEKSDASVLIKYIVGENVTVIPEALDINRDGKVTIVDAITILLYLAGKIESLN